MQTLLQSFHPTIKISFSEAETDFSHCRCSVVLLQSWGPGLSSQGHSTLAEWLACGVRAGPEISKQLLFEGSDSAWLTPSVTQPPQDNHILSWHWYAHLRPCDQHTDTFLIPLSNWHKPCPLSHWAPPPANLSALSFIHPEGEACRPEEVWLIWVTRCILLNSLQTCCLLSEEHRRVWCKDR